MDKESINDILFFNMFGNGDLHYSREFVKFFSSKIGLPAKYHHRKCSGLLRDIPGVEFQGSFPFPIADTNPIGLFQVDQTLLFSTWIGQEGCKWLHPDGCTIRNNYKFYLEHAKVFGIQIPEEKEFIPTIDYSKYHIDSIKISKDKNILICNGPALSGQSRNFDMSSVIVALAQKHPSCRFFVTQGMPTPFENIIDLNLMIDTNGLSNLNEISYVSLFCDIIVGRGSGPFCFTHVKENLYDKNKTYLVMGNQEREGNWVTMSDYGDPNCAKQIWIDSSYGVETNMFNIVDGEINEKFGNR